MKKLKFMLLILISIFCLNSCLLTTAAAGTYLLGTIGTYYCAEYDCTPTSKLKEKDSDGVKIFVEKKPLEVKSYFESIKKRGLVKIKGGKEETFVINLPKNFILKKMETGYYLYDEEKKIGFFSITDLKYFKEVYNGSTKNGDYKLAGNNKGVYTVIVKGNYTYKIKKLSENYYAITPYYENEIPKEAHEIYDYLIENL
jgi:hypothetical protein